MRMRGKASDAKVIAQNSSVDSTVHGVAHIGRHGRRVQTRVFWAVVVLVCLVALGFQIFLLVMRYLEYEVQTNVVVEWAPQAFPAVSICSQSPFKLSAAQSNSAVSRLISAFDMALSADDEDDAIDAEEATRLSGREWQPEITDVNGETGRRRRDADRQLHGSTILNSLVETRRDPDTKRSIQKRQAFPAETFETTKECSCKSRYSCVIVSRSSLLPFENLSRCVCQFYPKTARVDDCQECPAKGSCSFDSQWRPWTTTSTSTSAFTSTPSSTAMLTTPLLKTAPDPRLYGFEDGQDKAATAALAQESLMFIAAGLSEEEIADLSFQNPDLIKNCLFNTKTCDILKDFRPFFDPKFGRCIVFNGNRTHSQYTSKKAGPEYGLKLVMYANTSEYLTTTQTSGARVVVHSPSAYAFPDTFGFNAPTATASSFAIRPRKISRLRQPYGVCQHESSLHDYPSYGNYTLEGCLRSCLQNKFLAACGCGDPRFFLPANASFCELENNASKPCLREAEEALNMTLCGCEVPCVEETYEVTVSASKWPPTVDSVPSCSGNATSRHEYCADVVENGLMVEVFIEQLSRQLLWETPAFSTTSFISSIGGQVGLWTGISVVSLVEVALLVFRLCSFCLCCGDCEELFERVAVPEEEVLELVPQTASSLGGRTETFDLTSVRILKEAPPVLPERATLASSGTAVSTRSFGASFPEPRPTNDSSDNSFSTASTWSL